MVSEAKSGIRRAMTSFRMQLPQKFSFRRHEDWPKRSIRFERFHQASTVAQEEEETLIEKDNLGDWSPKKECC